MAIRPITISFTNQAWPRILKGSWELSPVSYTHLVLMLAGFGSFMYFAFNCTDILLMGARIEPLHVALGVIGILVLAELCRRCVGIPIIVVVGCLVIYAFYWQLTTGSNPDVYAALRKITQKLFYTCLLYTSKRLLPRGLGTVTSGARGRCFGEAVVTTQKNRRAPPTRGGFFVSIPCQYWSFVPGHPYDI